MLNFYRPGWDRDNILRTGVPRVSRDGQAIDGGNRGAVGVILHRLLLALGLGRAALPARWPLAWLQLWTGSQAAWQHGPAALCLITTIVLFHPQPASRLRLALAALDRTPGRLPV